MSPQARYAHLARQDRAVRFRHALRSFVERDAMWAARDAEGWLIFSHGGRTVLPVWPEPDFVYEAMRSQWPHAIAKRIALPDFMKTMSAAMQMDGTAVMVFPAAQQAGLVVSAAELGQHLAQELGNRFGEEPLIQLTAAMRRSVLSPPRHRLP